MLLSGLMVEVAVLNARWQATLAALPEANCEVFLFQRCEALFKY